MQEAAIQEVLKNSTSVMLEGMALLKSGCAQAALQRFEEVEALRGGLPWREHAESAWALAAVALNKGDALRGCSHPGEALSCYIRAVELMDRLPLAGHPAYVERLLLAWINCGVAAGEAECADEAFAAFDKADAILAEWGTDATPERRQLAAMAAGGRARILLDRQRPEEAWRQATRAVEVLRVLERAGWSDSAGVRARALVCQALAGLLDVPGGAEKAGDWIAEATDAAEEALALIRKGVFPESWMADLVRYGAKIYRACQPQFLGEFLADWAGPGGPFHHDRMLLAEMKNELLLARAELERKVLSFPHDSAWVETQTKILRAIQAGEAALARS